MRCLHFVNDQTNEEYITFTDEEEATVEDMAFPGFHLENEEQDVDLGSIMPGDGDAYFLRR